MFNIEHATYLSLCADCGKHGWVITRCGAKSREFFSKLGGRLAVMDLFQHGQIDIADQQKLLDGIAISDLVETPADLPHELVLKFRANAEFLARFEHAKKKPLVRQETDILDENEYSAPKFAEDEVEQSHSIN